MLFITFENDRVHGWHVGQPLLNLPPISQVKQVQADGDELEYITRHFTNLPLVNKRVVVWHGDLAKFIAQNL